MASGKQASVLIVDDSVDIHRLLKIRLRNEKVSIISATTAEDGFELARSERPDLILLDIDLPGISGFEVLSWLKDDAATVAIPVIFLSSSDHSEDKVRGFDLGAIDYVTKPFDLAELRARVRSALRTQALVEMLAQRAQLDGLTGLWNRTYLDARLSEFMARADRHGGSVSLILADVDHFKKVNDTYGHPFGDQVLQALADLLTRECRDSDIPCRYGGEEFAVILPDATTGEAVKAAERLLRSLEAFVWPDHDDLVITASFGVSSLNLIAERSTERFVASADSALYAAKRAGRRCVMVAEPDTGSVAACHSDAA